MEKEAIDSVKHDLLFFPEEIVHKVVQSKGITSEREMEVKECEMEAGQDQWMEKRETGEDGLAANSLSQLADENCLEEDDVLSTPIEVIDLCPYSVEMPEDDITMQFVRPGVLCYPISKLATEFSNLLLKRKLIDRGISVVEDFEDRYDGMLKRVKIEEWKVSTKEEGVSMGEKQDLVLQLKAGMEEGEFHGNFLIGRGAGAGPEAGKKRRFGRKRDSMVQTKDLKVVGEDELAVGSSGCHLTATRDQ